MKLHRHLLVLASGLAFAEAAHAQSLLNGIVRGVIDGDNLLIEINGAIREVNLAYIVPAPGESAAQYLEELLPMGTPVQIDVAFTLSTGRMYGYVYQANGLVNKQMLEGGQSLIYRASPNGVIQSWYQEAQTTAQVAGLGYWQGSSALLGSPQSNSLMPAASYVGVGTLVLAAVGVGLFKLHNYLRKRPTHPKQKLSQLQRSLESSLSVQKQLERDLATGQQKVEEWMARAKEAVQQNDDNLARTALVQKRLEAEKAEQLRMDLQQVSQQVTEIRTSIDQIQNQKYFH
ncbi:MAG: hypothetical protein HC921_13185 [Synechococcaceae cyanobacterium SM2_3_1]|nr:hypothetical protein [Synechococcaceae cyanobacterium SM2_3_1]